MRPRVFFASWAVALIEAWLAVATSVPAPSGTVISDEDSRYAATHFWPPAIIVLMITAAAALAVVVWPCILAAYGFVRRGGTAEYRRIFAVSLGCLILTSGIWALIIDALHLQLGKVMLLWGGLALYGLPPLLVALAFADRFRPATPATATHS